MHSPNGREPSRESCSRLTLSKWINERCPEWTTLLTDHEVARLTRRPRALLSALALLGRFPAPRRYHGKKLGWHRQEIQQWMAGRRSSAEDTPRKMICSARALRKKTFCRVQSIARKARHGNLT
jgi:predicted DNA-binding transcriptional regulator AlpA